jgi:hypothetical protein
MNKRNFPSPLRCLILGKSSCGKTALLNNLIIKNWGIPFHYLYIFFKSLEQHIYQELRKAYDKLSGTEEDGEIAYFFNSCDDLISVDEYEPNSLVVFDDCVNVQQQQIIKDYFVRGAIKIFLAYI